MTYILMSLVSVQSEDWIKPRTLLGTESVPLNAFIQSRSERQRGAALRRGTAEGRAA